MKYVTGLRPAHPFAEDGSVPTLVPLLCRVCRDADGQPAPVGTRTFPLCDFCRLLPAAALEFLLVPERRRRS
jgi:hypothetical protein